MSQLLYGGNLLRDAVKLQMELAEPPWKERKPGASGPGREVPGDKDSKGEDW